MNSPSAAELKRGYAEEWLSSAALVMIWTYRSVLSPVLFSVCGPRCRFEPTCSQYAAEAIARYGILDGGLMTIKRLMKCRPLGGWGPDPVPIMHSARDLTSASTESRRH
ncbi:MAG: membrane protein insertion efficiency factor YidD [Deltaproteobacteria bacterium]|nr:membrane protein insertion efficiency factor YidD [Deltaproteobacteria bacterium]